MSDNNHPSPQFNSPIPVSLITGYLGAGKTTLLNRLLSSTDSSGFAVIVNEFGDVGLDHILVEKSDEGVILLDSGCLCCTIRGDIEQTFSDLWQREEAGEIAPITRFIIETTGLADPTPVLHLFIAHPILRLRLRVDGVVGLVDAINGIKTLETHQEAARQGAGADRILVTKTDLLNPDDGRLPALISSIRSLNPSAKLIEVDQADIPADIVDIGLFNPKTKSLDVQRWLGRADGLASTVNAPSPAHHHAHDHSSEHDPSHDHDHQISSFSLIHDQPVPFAILEGFLDLLRASQGSHLLRVKGIICLAEEPDQPIVIHGVQQVMHPPVTLPAWPTDDHRSRLIFITHNCPKNVVERLFGAFTGGVSPDTADADALQNNPLAISGFTSN